MRKPLALVALTGAIGFAGCGGGDSTTSTTTFGSGATGASGPSGSAALPQDVIDQGNQICAQGNQELGQAFGQLGQNPSQAEADQAIENQVIPNIQGQIDDIRALSDDEALSSALDDAQSTLDQAKNDPSIMEQGNAFSDVNKEFTALGLKTCASD